MHNLKTVRAIDSHTAGEPTRVVLSGGPELTAVPLDEKLNEFRTHHDSFRCSVVKEPRGSEELVGALLVPPADPTCIVGVIFFNNVGYLGMCGHGTIGLVTTLGCLGWIEPGEHRIETPVGVVSVRLRESGAVSVVNVPSFRLARRVSAAVEGYGTVGGDVAWGGNWFFLVEDHGLELSPKNIEQLTDYTWKVRLALAKQGIRGCDGHEIDHIELFGPPEAPGAQSKNFVLCPGKAYDRSPCGTGLSAKLACLYADGKLQDGEVWRQESITGTTFDGMIRACEDKLIPTITGRAYITAYTTLVFDPSDTFTGGIG